LTTFPHASHAGTSPVLSVPDEEGLQCNNRLFPNGWQNGCVRCFVSSCMEMTTVSQLDLTAVPAGSHGLRKIDLCLEYPMTAWECKSWEYDLTGRLGEARKYSLHQQDKAHTTQKADTLVPQLDELDNPPS